MGTFMCEHGAGDAIGIDDKFALYNLAVILANIYGPTSLWFFLRLKTFQLN